MNNKFAKKLLAVTIAASMMVVPVVAGAATGSTSGNSSSSETTATVEEVKAPQTANVVAGTKSTVAGAIYVKEATGLAVTTPASALGTPAGATAFLKAYSVNAKSAPASAKVAADYVAAQGGKQIAFFNLELGYMQNKKFVRSTQDQTFDMVIGVKNAANATLEGLQILPGGTALSVQDADTAANTFTATGLKAGLSALCVYSK